PHAFVWQDGMMTDLNDLVVGSGWSLLSQANAVNDAGQIVGVGTNPDGLDHAFLFDPADNSVTDLRPPDAPTSTATAIHIYGQVVRRTASTPGPRPSAGPRLRGIRSMPSSTRMVSCKISTTRFRPAPAGRCPRPTPSMMPDRLPAPERSTAGPTPSCSRPMAAGPPERHRGRV